MKEATVKDIAEIMTNLIAEGKGDYVVTCNMEYTLAMKGDLADLDDDNKTADLGGYT